MSDIDHTTAEILRSFIQRVERLEAEKRTIADDIKEIYAEAKSNGFDPKIMRKVIALRKLKSAERQEQEYLLATYIAALGMTPLEQAIAENESDEDRPKHRPGFAPNLASEYA